MAPAGPNRYGGAPLANGPIVGHEAPIIPSDYDRAFTYAVVFSLFLSLSLY